MSHASSPAVYLVAGCHPWSRRAFDAVIRHYPGEWHFVDHRENLMLENIQLLHPRAIFFLHWSWKVPDEIIEAYECINFHMTDVPYGRGGSPLQNLILRGHATTKVSALRMTRELDAGPVYCKADLSLVGSAQEILERASTVSASMIEKIIRERPEPISQQGEVVLFKRRTPAESALSPGMTPAQLYNFIRMLDADGYPRAFLESGGFRYEFCDAILYDGTVEANVRITLSEPSLS